MRENPRTMFNPSQADVRRFFCAVHAKRLQQQPMEAIETLAGQWIAEHPEYHPELADVDAALARLGEPVMECLGTMLWESQRAGRPPDGQAYIDAVRRRATKD